MFPFIAQRFEKLTEGEHTLEIYNPKGSVLKSLDIRNGSVIDVSGFVDGSYLFVLKTPTMDYLASNMLIVKE